MWQVLIDWPISHLLNLFMEELLIDFRELIGSHSGETLATAIWETLELYGLQGQVSATTGYCSKHYEDPRNGTFVILCCILSPFQVHLLSNIC